MEICAVAAMGRNHEIGRKGGFPWAPMRADMARFVALTKTHAVIMGRRTKESLRKPLKDRANIVLARSPVNIELPYIRANSLPEGIDVASKMDVAKTFIIGGAEVYRESLEAHVQRVYLTVIDADFSEADTFFSDLPEARWRLTQREAFLADEKNPYPYAFLEYERRT
ncbi:MAG: dihydrofolate reductase [Patescibacteria group bacterium]